MAVGLSPRRFLPRSEAVLARLFASAGSPKIENSASTVEMVSSPASSGTLCD